MMALLRRLLTNLIPQNYDMLTGTTRIADYKQNINPLSYNLTVDLSTWNDQFDRRIAIASAILLAAVEGRQG